MRTAKDTLKPSGRRISRPRFHLRQSGVCSLRVVALHVGLPRGGVWRGKEVTTGIYKSPVDRPVMLRTMNLDGDAQADLSVHGGRNKAAYAYPSEHYAYWRGELPGADLPWGTFGENFTTEGMDEHTVHAGDRLRIGEAEVVVTQPRFPCYKLCMKLGRSDMSRRFRRSGRTGFYMRVEREGLVGRGDTIGILALDPGGVSIADMVRLRARGGGDGALLARALRVEAIPGPWKEAMLEASGGGR